VVSTSSTGILWRAFKKFYAFSPVKQSIILALAFIEGLTAGIGILLIIPLLQLIGLDMGGASSVKIANIAHHFFGLMTIELTLFTILASYILLIGCIASLRSVLAVMSKKVQQAYMSHLRSDLYRRLLLSRWEFVVESKMSDLLHSLSSQIGAVGFTVNLMFTLASRVMLMVIMVALVLLLSWKIALLAAAFAVALLALLLPLNKHAHNSGKVAQKGSKDLFQMLSEQLGSLKMIKSFASEDHYSQQMAVLSDRLEEQCVQLVKISAATKWVTTMGSVVGFSIIFFVALEVMSISLGTLFLLLIIFSRLLVQLSWLQKTYQQLLHRVPALEDISGILHDFDRAREQVITKVTCPELRDRIQVKDISYQYPKAPQAVFEGLSFTIHKNQTLAIVGPSGVGKSTLMDIIAGLLEPAQGSIYCDTVRLDTDLRLAWRKGVAYITQDVYLFHDTVRANLSWVASAPPTDADLWAALKDAAADDFVADMPSGLDSMIGDRGIKLSGGERQRIALARALLSKPQLLILDEATSALDDANEQKIQCVLERLQGKLTIVIVAHRETTISYVDKRIELGKKALQQLPSPGQKIGNGR
jgi:ATP-binding cassette, subfamily C, bacterial